MRKVLGVVVVAGMVAGCSPAQLAPVVGVGAALTAGLTIPSKVQSACQVASWGLPLAQQLLGQGRLNPTEQDIVNRTGQIVGDCVSGNVSAAVTDVANGLVAILWTKH